MATTTVTTGIMATTTVTTGIMAAIGTMATISILPLILTEVQALTCNS
jgi:hypothetical protein